MEYNITKNQPISLQSLLSLIPDMFNEKIELNNKFSKKGGGSAKFDEFFYDYMKDKYKLYEVIDNNCEQVVSAILKYQSVDKRVELYRKFLGLEPEPIRVEILDSYLQILKSIILFIYFENQHYQFPSTSYILQTKPIWSTHHSHLTFTIEK